jgi:chorismate mutase-like protein
MNNLSELREKIDTLDTSLLALLNERASLAMEIGVIKNRESLPVYSPERETLLLKSLVERSSGPLRPEAIRAIYREIMSASLSLEKDVAIACAGPAGSASHRAAMAKFGSSVRYTHGPSIAAVFEEVRRDRADCGVVPLEDPEHGFLNHTMDELAATDLVICAEIRPDGETPEEGVSARYIVLGRKPNGPSANDQTMIMLRIENKPGGLVEALEPFRGMKINIDRIASRPAMKGSLDSFFFVQAEGHQQTLQQKGLFRELSKNCRAVKILGSYPGAGN